MEIDDNWSYDAVINEDEQRQNRPESLTKELSNFCCKVLVQHI